MRPISGPFRKQVNTGRYVSDRWVYRQKRPYNVPAPYNAGIGNASLSTDGWRYKAFAEDGLTNRPDLYARAYSRLAGKLGDTASLGITLVQWRQSADMVVKRANQLSAFTTALYNRSPIGVAASLGLRLRQVRRVMDTQYGVAKKLSDLWLEFWFGWKPLVSDIYSALEVFESPMSWAPIRAGASGKFEVSWGQGLPWQETGSYSGVHACKIGIDVRLVNPNLRLLQQMGLLNLAEVVYDGIAWSFVLGWFSNVQSYLSAFTTFAGLETDNGFITWSRKLEGKTSFPMPDTIYGTVSGTGKGFAVSRGLITQVPRPSFVWRNFDMPTTRALTAISLLVQKLPRQ